MFAPGFSLATLASFCAERLIGDSKLTEGVNVRVNGCLSPCWRCNTLATCLIDPCRISDIGYVWMNVQYDGNTCQYDRTNSIGPKRS